MQPHEYYKIIGLLILAIYFFWSLLEKEKMRQLIEHLEKKVRLYEEQRPAPPKAPPPPPSNRRVHELEEAYVSKIRELDNRIARQKNNARKHKRAAARERKGG